MPTQTPFLQALRAAGERLMRAMGSTAVTVAAVATVGSIVASGAAGTFVLWRSVVEGEQREAQTIVANQARAKANDVQGVLGLVQEAVTSVGAHLAATGSDAAFDTFAQSALRRHETILALGWVEVAAGGAGQPSHRGRAITQRDWLGNLVPMQRREQHFALTRLTLGPAGLEQSEALGALIGFDFGSDDYWLEMFGRARRASGVQFSYRGLNATDSVLILPVRPSAPGGEAADPTGYVIALVTLPKLIARGLGAESTTLFNRVFDAGDASGLKLIFPASTARPSAAEAVSRSERGLQRALVQRESAQVLGTEWVVETEPTIGFLRSRKTGVAEAVLGVGALATLLLASYVVALRTRNRKVERLVAERGAQLERAHAELRDAEMMTLQSEKMSSIGQMVAGVAHEINTPLGFVSANLQMLKELNETAFPALRRQAKLMHWVPRWDKLNREQRHLWYRTALANLTVLENLEQRKSLEDGEPLVGESLVGLERIHQIVLSLKDFSRIDRAQVDAVDIHQCIDSTLVIAHNVVKHKAAIIKEYGPLPPVTCSPSQINQVILNLVTNAAQAIEHEGHIWISTACFDEHIVIEVRDDGPGVPHELQSRVFEPFFTTKAAGEGTGLGLSICEKIVRAHGGKISLSSEPGRGCAFKVQLPIKGRSPSAASAAPERRPSVAEPARASVVEMQ
jgi:signal transduction histidine kinase